ncbi:UNVERIFIED_CONTAM: Auxin response factor 17 [Sesamum radiatum]|uniref:Auxin response factor n=1 Tax=Sesamum radiatum TaxID=300843 RepID=A0AAW2SIY8_SESRA
MSNSSSSSSAVAAEVDAAIWRAVVGSSVQVPSLNSYVYYFPEGHLEHTSSSASIYNYNFALPRPFIPCQVLSIRFLSDHPSDQAFVRILLQPLQPLGPRPMNNDDDDNTRTDVLDFAADPPVQNLTLKDTHNNAWEFRHIYRGTPRRHLLTTGWSKFVNAKRLVAGDTVVFMKKKSTNELFVGIRRASRVGGNEGQDGGEALEAIQKAARGMAFEVVYCPKAGCPDFVVKAEKVKDALRICWRQGMRVRMGVETDDSSRMTWFQGTIAATTSAGTGPWYGSPWRMLQVTWDEPESLQNVNRVNPWQVEYIPATPLFDPEFPPSKKLRITQNPEAVPAGEGDFRLPQLTRPMVGHLNPAALSYAPFSAGMQGARPDHICISNASSDRNLQTSNELPKNDAAPELKTVSTVLSIGSSYSDNLSHGSQSSVQFRSTDPLGQPGPSSSSKTGANSFQLFGKIIQMPEPVGGGSKLKATCTDGGKESSGHPPILLLGDGEGFLSFVCNPRKIQLVLFQKCDGLLREEDVDEWRYYACFFT